MGLGQNFLTLVKQYFGCLGQVSLLWMRKIILKRANVYNFYLLGLKKLSAGQDKNIYMSELDWPLFTVGQKNDQFRSWPIPLKNILYLKSCLGQ